MPGTVEQCRKFLRDREHLKDDPRYRLLYLEAEVRLLEAEMDEALAEEAV